MMALSTGFVLVAALATLIGPSLQSVFAEDDDRAAYLRSLRAERGQHQQARSAPSPQYVAMAPVRGLFSFMGRPSEPRKVQPTHMAYAPAQAPANFGPFGAQQPAPLQRLGAPSRRIDAVAPLRSNSTPATGSASLSRRSVCVRLCDGFYFPVGDYNGAEDNAPHGAVCGGLCPGAPTRLYVMPSGSEKIEDAVSVRDNRSYRALPVAFRHTTQRDNTCSCNAPGASTAQSVSLLKDFTLRRGDRVMTESGFRIFKGAPQMPYRVADFSSLSQSRDISESEKGALRKIERISRGGVVAQATPRPAPAGKPIALTPITSRTVTDSAGKSIRLIGPQAMATGLATGLPAPALP